MRKQLPYTAKAILVLTLFFSINFYAQCVDNSIRPADNFVVSTYSPRCHNGSDGELRFSNIFSTVGANDFTNQQYTVRILSGPSGPLSYALPLNTSTYVITGLPAGSYLVDVIDQCGGNNSDKLITIFSAQPNVSSMLTSITHNGRYSTPGNCGDVLKFKLATNSGTTSGDATYTFLNNLGQTLTFVNPIGQTVNYTFNQFRTDISIPVAFFNGADLTYTGFNNCGSITGGSLALPIAQDIIFDAPRIISVENTNNTCALGFDVKMFRVNVTNPIQISVEEASNPGGIALDINDQPIMPQSVDLTHFNAAPLGGSVPISLGLKFNVDYVITLVDACGITFQKTMTQQSVPFEPSVSCHSGIWTGDTVFFDDITFLNLNELPISSLTVAPLTITFNSGPTTYSTQSGAGPTINSSMPNYPFSTVVNTPNISSPLSIDAIKSFPSGTYNFTVTDACGKTSTFDYTAPCTRSLEVTHSLDYCGMVTGDVMVYLKVPAVFSGTTAAIYKADGTLVMSGNMGFGPPFHFSAIWGGYQISFSLPNNEQYYFRYGGVVSHNIPMEPQQFGGVNGLPRLPGGYLYEYAFDVVLSPFAFATIDACDTVVEMVATGGKAPFTYALYDATATTQLAPYQSSSVFTGLTPGMTYTAKTMDDCGREFTQVFYVYEAPQPVISSLIQPTCQSSEGTVTFENLPAHWSITEINSGTVYTGTTPTFTIANLQPNTYNYMCTDVLTNCANQAALAVVIEAYTNCPIATDDVILYNYGATSTIAVTSNDVQGALVNPQTIRFIAPSSATNLVYCATGQIIGCTIPAEGNWLADIVTGMVTFQPLSTFTGVPSSISYNVKDFQDNLSNTAIISFDLLPVAVDDTLYYSVGTSLTINVLANDTLGDLVNPQTVAFVAPSTPAGVIVTPTEMIVPGEGSWLIDSVLGTITFVPVSGFYGTPSAITYYVADFQGNPSNHAVISLSSQCLLAVTCPIFTTTTVQCYDEIPAEMTLTVAQFEQLGNQSGTIGASLCGIVVITAANSPNTGCNTSVVRTYTISVYLDTNLNGLLDASENTVLSTQTCTQMFQLEDTIAPVFSGNLPTDVTVECFTIPVAATLSATDNCSDVSIAFKEEVIAGACANFYSLIRTWSASDVCGNMVTHVQTITVQDTTAPVFTISLPIGLVFSSLDEVPDYDDLDATDSCGTVQLNYDESVIEGTCLGTYDLIRTWTAVDACGNTTTLTQTVAIEDRTPPVFINMPESILYVDCGVMPEVAPLEAVDAISAVTVTFEETKEQGDCFSLTTIVRTWTATDACGNVATFVQTFYMACEITIYNALTPNEDGKNDFFYLEGIECYPNNSVAIFNRYGAKVYEVKGYDNVNAVFKGKSSTGLNVSTDVLPVGTYFYIINYEFQLENMQQKKNVEKTGYLYVTTQ
ncbi:gliding motility-associated C-terminal domain-containing protein [Flavobacterium sp. N2820]|uniref:T9SS type B sorting domain-containing protein n=1 Tax=Flavobacterium sp. N2820 TaxID=2986834 RepID=UPI0022248197|nr:gliding motility-associated C-terminal domain-containing protein [Flavobacterium sp. N2820]